MDSFSDNVPLSPLPAEPEKLIYPQPNNAFANIDGNTARRLLLPNSIAEPCLKKQAASN